MWPTQSWFSDLLSLAEVVIVLEKSSKIFLPVNKFNRAFAGSTKWPTMLLKISPHKKKKWINLKVEQLQQLGL